jgi:cell wall-associated NlpC family hydrolase
MPENKMAIWDEQQSKWEFKKIRVHNEECRAVEYAKSFRGVFYKWGGDDPSGFDCSGFVIEVLKAVGCLKRIGDWTAAGLFELFEKIPENYIAPGDLVFWSNPAGKIIHVEMIIAGKLSIGASGGGSATITAVDAIRQNAYIKVRPIYSRPAIAGFANPYKPVYNI